MEYTDRVYELLDRAEELEYGQTRNGLLEDAVRLADEARDVELGYEAREELITSLQFSGYPDRVLTHFVWCLARFDERPEKYDEFRLLWQYKWVVGSLADFPDVGREKIGQALEDFERRVRRAGFGLHPVFVSRWHVARALGDNERARAERERFLELTPNELSNCRACDVNANALYLAEQRDYEGALRAAEPILRGELQCASVPHGTMAGLLYPLLRLGRHADAEQYHRQGYRLIRGNYRNFLKRVGQHILYLVLTDQRPRAVRIFERSVGGAVESRDYGQQLEFYNAARILWLHIQRVDTSRIKLRVPRDLPFFQESGDYEVAALIDWFDRATRDLAARYDRRNGNDWCSARMNGKLALLDEASFDQ